MMSELIKVIVADDNKVERNAICNLITKSGLPLMLADSFSNGEDALLYIENNNVDIIVSDIQMPQLTGIKLIKELNKKSSNTKVIFISCYDDFYYAKDAIEIHGVFKGIILAIGRLMRCNILFPGGVDPVPPKKERKCNCKGNHQK